VIRKQNGGVSSARNAGLGAARGGFIGFVDSDDWIEPGMYEALYAAIINHDAQIAACGYAIHRYDGVVFDDKVDPATPECLGLEQALMSLIHPRGIQGFLCNKLFDRKLLESSDGGLLLLDERIHICEDLLFVSRCVETAGRVAYDSRPFYVYCVRDYGGPENYNRERRVSELIALEQLVESWSGISEKLGGLMKCKYVTDAYHIIRAVAAARDREYIPAVRKYVQRYLKPFLCSNTVKPSRKTRVLLAIAFPNLENLLKKTVRG